MARKVFQPRRRETPPEIEGWYRPLPYLVLAAALGVALLAGPSPSDPSWWRPGVLIGSAVTAIWTLAMLRGEPSRRRLVVYFVVRLALTGFLVAINPWFGIYAWSAYVEAIAFFPWPRSIPAIVASAAVAAGSYLGGVPQSTGAWLLWGLLVVGGSVLVSTFAVIATRDNTRQAERDRMMAELVDTNRRLADALTENQVLADRVIAQAREAGIRDERARLAREIHDTLAQSLMGIVTQLQAADGNTEINRALPGGARHVDAALGLARTGLTEARRSLQALRPGPLVDTRLPDAVRRTASEWSDLTGIPATVEIDGDPLALGTEKEVALLRAAQEALANVAKHAAASTVWVTLSFLDGEVMLDVRDDGSGFSPRERTAGGADGLAAPGSVMPGDAVGPAGTQVGLAAMRERLARVGGEVAIETEPGAGTTVVARVPGPTDLG